MTSAIHRSAVEHGHLVLPAVTTGNAGAVVAGTDVVATTAGDRDGDGVRALLADGRVVLVRPLTPEDQDRVRVLHENLDEHDQYFRFFGPLPPRLTDLVFGMTAPCSERHGSMGAFLDGALIGVAHYEVLADPARAELALAVTGGTQAHGVGTLLLAHLVSLARRRGVRRFVAEVLTENGRMLRVLRDCGLPCRMAADGSVTEVDLTLVDDERYRDVMAGRERGADTASLRPLLCPESLAVIGAGRRAGSIGNAVLSNILAGGYRGAVYAVNPHVENVLGVPAFPAVGAVPAGCELAVLCVPADAVGAVAEECGRAGVKALVVISAGLTGDPLRQGRLLAAVRRYGMRLVGPNCVGITNTDPAVRLDATFAPPPAPAGTIGLATQSGGIGIALRERLRQAGLGISTMISVGDKYDVSGNDLLMWWQQDEATTAAVLYLESFGNPRKFGRLARTLARRKPVLAVRAGTTEAAQRAAASHTAATATPAVTRDALFRQAGVLAVDTPEELVATLAALTWQPLPHGNRLAVVTNAGGAGILAADACAAAGIVLPELAPETRDTLRGLLPGQASLNNPVDTTAAVDAPTFNRVVAVVAADPGVDAVIAATVPTAVGDPSLVLAAVAVGDKPVLAVRLAQAAAVAALPGADGHPVTACYAEPAEAVAVLGRTVEYARWRARPDSVTGPPSDVDLAGALGVIRARLRAEPAGGWLSAPQVVALLRCFGIPVTDTRFAAGEDLAAEAFAELGGGPVAVKAVAEGLLHKSAQGGVLLDVRDEAGVRAAVREFTGRFGTALHGVLVQPIAAPGRELLVGVHSDATFGPLVVFGLGGVDTDLLADRAARLAPLDEADAGELLHGLRCSNLLFGPAAEPGLDVAAVRDVLLRIGFLAQLVPEIVELDLNPLILRSKGCEVVDARIRVEPATSRDPFLPALRS